MCMDVQREGEYLEAEDEEDLFDKEEPQQRRKLTFAYTLSEEDGDYFWVDARVEDATLKIEAKGITQLFAIQAAVLNSVEASSTRANVVRGRVFELDGEAMWVTQLV
eukprot:jgi/Tetstr1/457743/TSEL_044288.t1